MHPVTSEWLRILKCRQKRKTTRQRGRIKREDCQRKYFDSFKYVTDRTSIPFFTLRNQFTLLQIIPNVLLATSFKLRLLCSSRRLIAIPIFYLNIYIFFKKSQVEPQAANASNQISIWVAKFSTHMLLKKNTHSSSLFIYLICNDY